MVMYRRYLLGASALMILISLAMLTARYMHWGGRWTASSDEWPTIQFVKHPVAVPEMSFQDLDGKTITTRDWKGKVTIVNFWATWCPPCREEIPAFITLQERYRDSVQFVGVSIDDPADVDDVRAFVREQKINYPIVMLTPELTTNFGQVFAVPTSFIVDRDVRTVQKHIGLINPGIYELEARVLAGIPTDVHVETVEDTGKVLLANAALATEIPGVDLSVLTPDQKKVALKRLNEEHCTCGCALTLAQCRINDPSCETSPSLARQIVEEERVR
jgi:thiol-disulfide isomerase/thioredoxin